MNQQVIFGKIDPTLHVTVIANDIEHAADEPFLFGQGCSCLDLYRHARKERM
jgi:hypothetical protein